MPRQKRQADQPSREWATKDPPDDDNTTAQIRSSPSSPLIPDHLLRFLNALPTTGDVIEWTRSFRESLQMVLGDIDRVVVHVDTQCDLSYGEQWRPALKPGGPGETPRRRGKAKVEASWMQGKTPSELLMEDFNRIGYPLGDYHPPQSYDYYYTEHTYLGTIFLLRDRTKKPISRRTLEAMKGLEPFVIFALSDLVARYAYIRPIDRAFQKALRELALETKLTKRELQVLTLHLFGRRYEEIARKLYISIDTVKKHVKKIHRKTGSRSSTELFARYFTPLIDLENLDVQLDQLEQ
jgi:DNA-binding CsgD family transcriptional regulator